MKKIILSLLLMGVNSSIFGQATGPIGNAWAAPKFLGFDASNGTNPLFFRTNALNRMKINGNVNYAINGYASASRNGNVLIGAQNTSMALGNANIYTQAGAFSLLHLNGAVTGGVDNYQEFGYRPWMYTGLTMTGNRDFAYFGLRQVGTTADRSEAVFLWADNGAGGGSDSPDGPDNMVFRFSGYGGSDGATVSANRISTTDLDGLHVATFNPTGYFGLGNTFGLNSTGMTAANYIRPQSLMHMSYDYRAGANFQPYGFMQVTYRRPDNQGADFIGQGETANDGLRFGIDNNLFNTSGINHLNGYMRWQENSPFIFQTDWDNIAGNTNLGERMRISSNASPGVPATLLNAANTTRVSISYLGNTPITQPRALLHLGANNSTTVGNWMDNGTLVSTTGQSIFTGITPSNYTDPSKAVLGFGGSDLTIRHTGIGEVARISQSTGNLGIGNFGPGGIGVPTERIDVNGNGRFRNIPAQGGQSLIIGLQQGANANDVEFSRLNFTGNAGQVLLGNGTWGTAPGSGSGGYFSCSDPAADMSADARFNLNTNNFYFEGDGSINPLLDRVGIGHPCGNFLNAKLDVLSSTGGISGNFWTLNGTGATGMNVGVFGYSGGSSGFHVGVLGRTGAPNSSFDAGIYGSPSNSAGLGWGGYFTGDVWAVGNIYPSDSTLKNNIQPLESALSLVSKLQPKTYYMNQTNNAGMSFDNNLHYGFISQEVQQILPDVVRLEANPLILDSNNNVVPYTGQGILGLNYDAFIPINTAAIKELDREVQNRTLSDQTIKTNVLDLNNSLTKVLAMRGVSYDWTANGQANYNLDTCNHVGFIAQELQLVDPRLTFIGRDSLIHVEYEKVVPILVEAIEELNDEVVSKDSIINAMNTRLTNLENCLSGILPFLCQLSHSAIQANTPESQAAIRTQLSVKLTNMESIILDQNVPNPFAEQTVINFSIPETVQKAQIHFYNSEGRIIQSVDVVERGLGSITVFGSDLSTGIYTYTLVADGISVATKKMMKN